MRSRHVRAPRFLFWPVIITTAAIDTVWWVVKLPFRAAWSAIIWSATLDLEARADKPHELVVDTSDLVDADDPGVDVDGDEYS